MKKYPALEVLLAGYLTFDWPEEYGEPWNAVENFFRSESEYRLLIPGEVADLIHSAPSEIELRRYVVDEIYCGYLPEADGWTYRDWLEEIARRAVDPVSAVQSPVPMVESGQKSDE